ncbi:poly(A)-specific ribonuclease PARN-like [Leguminivora glycinivorella]|uniref:poly(A)-specific ribonuclease PARN-like n=1 Tax=Leguminivora glycinivorella TaxID=1035111 RepID=UPI00200E0446|nr:poly(A)-specific ribonuclease PARN-like [Leguminivora glycinivorella]
MEITRKNFKESLPIVSDSIKRADFLVIDAEFTGLINGPDVTMFDSPAEYYLRTMMGCKDFLLIQYGLCAFYWDEDAKQYMNDAYNFYLFPRGRPGPERMFLCQSSSLDFLSAQGFDFNKLIRDGIPYMTEPTETRLREMLTERQKSYANDTNIIPVPEENKQQIEDICKKVREFLDEQKSDEMEIDRCNAFIRRLLFQELGSRFKGEAYVETKVLENKNRVLKVTRVTPENAAQDREAMKKDKEWEEFEEAVGFSKVARMISQSEKLVVGHNMLLDVIHTLNHFFQPLPPDYPSFKEFAHCMFPSLLDTKYMSSLPPFKDKVNSSVLQHLLVTLSEPPFGLPTVGSSPGRGYTLSNDKSHEAGYDAFVTGLCFLAMRAHVARMRGEDGAGGAGAGAALRPFLNKLFLTKTAYQDSPYMNIDGPDPSPSRDHVFHLTFPMEWQRNDINQLFSPFGPIVVQFIDDTSAYVALSRREQARDVMRTLARHKRTTLVPYAKFKHMASQDSKHWRKEDDTIPETPRLRQAASTTSVSPAPPKSPVKDVEPIKERARSNSLTSQPPSRKRTSSGMFQVDETEPPPKKPEPSRKRPEVNGKKDSSEPKKGKQDKDKDTAKKQEKKVIERFDEEAKTQCVSAFKESDSWD